MAKIALISRSISPQVLELAKGLIGQRHEVQIITSYKASLESPENIQILGYFKKWSWLEGVKFLPRLVGRAPDVFHFFFEQEEDKAHAAHWVLSIFAQQFHKAIVISLGSPKIDTKVWKKSAFLKNCKAVIVPSREKLMYLKRQKLIDDSIVGEVILPFHLPELSLPKNSAHLTNSLHEISLKWKPYILVPAHPEKRVFENLFAQTQSSGLRLVFLGERSSKLYSDTRCVSLTETTEAELKMLVGNSQALFLAAHQFEPSELMRWQEVVSATKTPIVALRRQTELLPGLCLDGRNGFVIENLHEDLHKLLQNSPLLEIQKYQRFADIQTPADLSLNKVNRLYIRALSPAL